MHYEEQRSNERRSIAVDLDGTLAEYHGWKGEEHIGDPIPKMVDRVKSWLADGHGVTIFTARACDESSIKYVKAWCKVHIGTELPVTNTKHKRFGEFWDDRAVQVISNTGDTITNKYAKMVAGESVLNTQVGGSHYKGMKIQPVEFCHANKIQAIEAGVIKYVCRHSFKNGKQDIDKAIHLLQLLKELEYPE